MFLDFLFKKKPKISESEDEYSHTDVFVSQNVTVKVDTLYPVNPDSVTELAKKIRHFYGVQDKDERLVDIHIKCEFGEKKSLDDAVGLFYFNGTVYFKPSASSTAKTLDGKKTILDVFKENHPTIDVSMSDLKIAYKATVLKVLNF